MEAKKKPQLILTDWLAIDRTKLANERTFLAYFRSFIVIVSSGVAIIRIEFLDEIQQIGWFFVVIGPLLLIIGVARFLYVRRHINRLYNLEQFQKANSNQ
jgi:putative membrane protein